MQLLVHEVLQEDFAHRDVRAAAVHGGDESGKGVHLREILHRIVAQRVARKSALVPGLVVGMIEEAVVGQYCIEAGGQFHDRALSFALGR
jgi:hypothetical protein